METIIKDITIGNNLSNLADNSKAWVYTSEKEFTQEDINVITQLSEVYLSEWDSHGKLLKGSIQILKNRFIAIFADAEGDAICGSAQDKSVRFIKELEEITQKSLMNRMLIAFETLGGISVLPMNDLRDKIKTGEISEESLFYNGLVTSKKEFLTNWKIPIKGSWI